MFDKTLPLALLIISLVYFLKPSVFFDSVGQSREFGSGIDEDNKKKTYITFSHFIVIVCVFLALYGKN